MFPKAICGLRTDTYYAMSGQPQSTLTPEQYTSLWASLGLSPERGAELLKTVGERSPTFIIDAINLNVLRIVGELGRQDGLCLEHSLEQLVDSIEIPSSPGLDADEPQNRKSKVD